MLFRLLLFSLFLTCCVVKAQTTPPDTATRPAILGNLDGGKYSNRILGFELQLDPACTFSDEARAVAWSTQLPQRLSLAIRCRDELYLLSSFPLHADESIDLKRDAQVSLQGAMDGGGFKKHGSSQNRRVNGTEVLVQGLTRHGASVQELGSYHAFMVGRRYVSILTIGPAANKAELAQVTARLTIKPTP
jgi:hypothetical protein